MSHRGGADTVDCCLKKSQRSPTPSSSTEVHSLPHEEKSLLWSDTHLLWPQKNTRPTGGGGSTVPLSRFAV